MGPLGRDQQSPNPGVGSPGGPKENKQTACGPAHRRVFARQEGH